MKQAIWEEKLVVIKLAIILHCSNGQDCNAAMRKSHNPLQRLDYI